MEIEYETQLKKKKKKKLNHIQKHCKIQGVRTENKNN